MKAILKEIRTQTTGLENIPFDPTGELIINLSFENNKELDDVVTSFETDGEKISKKIEELIQNELKKR
jgi:hypothetical protein